MSNTRNITVIFPSFIFYTDKEKLAPLNNETHEGLSASDDTSAPLNCSAEIYILYILGRFTWTSFSGHRCFTSWCVLCSYLWVWNCTQFGNVLVSTGLLHMWLESASPLGGRGDVHKVCSGFKRGCENKPEEPRCHWWQLVWARSPERWLIFMHSLSGRRTAVVRTHEKTSSDRRQRCAAMSHAQVMEAAFPQELRLQSSPWSARKILCPRRTRGDNSLKQK